MSATRIDGASPPAPRRTYPSAPTATSSGVASSPSRAPALRARRTGDAIAYT